MSDFESFRREVGAQVRPPDFDDVAAVGSRRRLAAVGWSAASVAAVVGVVAFGLQGGYGDQSAPVVPVVPANPTHSPGRPTPTISLGTPTAPDENPAQHRRTASQVVNDRNSWIAAVAVSHSSPDTRAVAWKHCIDGEHNCNRPQFALTVTADNFATSHDIDLPGRNYPVVVAVGPDKFYAAAGDQAQLIGSDGTADAVRMDPQRSPLAANEVFLGHTATYGNHFLALNPRTAVTHPISIPQHAGLTSLVANADGWLVGETSGPGSDPLSRALMWSSDGGAAWQTHVLSTQANQFVDVIPSESTSHILAAFAGGDGATLFPFDTVYRSTDGGATWQTFDESPDAMAYVGWAVVDPDGSLLVQIDAWSDAPPGQPGSRKHPVGLYQSAVDDWSNLRYVQDMPTGYGLALGDYSPTQQGELRLWLYDTSHGRLYESGPGIDTWAEVPSR